MDLYDIRKTVLAILHMTSSTYQAQTILGELQQILETQKAPADLVNMVHTIHDYLPEMRWRLSKDFTREEVYRVGEEVRLAREKLADEEWEDTNGR